MHPALRPWTAGGVQVDLLPRPPWPTNAEVAGTRKGHRSEPPSYHAGAGLDLYERGHRALNIDLVPSPDSPHSDAEIPFLRAELTDHGQTLEALTGGHTQPASKRAFISPRSPRLPIPHPISCSAPTSPARTRCSHTWTRVTSPRACDCIGRRHRRKRQLHHRRLGHRDEAAKPRAHERSLPRGAARRAHHWPRHAPGHQQGSKGARLPRRGFSWRDPFQASISVRRRADWASPGASGCAGWCRAPGLSGGGGRRDAPARSGAGFSLLRTSRAFAPRTDCDCRTGGSRPGLNRREPSCARAGSFPMARTAAPIPAGGARSRPPERDEARRWRPCRRPASLRCHRHTWGKPPRHCEATSGSARPHPAPARSWRWRRTPLLGVKLPRGSAAFAASASCRDLLAALRPAARPPPSKVLDRRWKALDTRTPARYLRGPLSRRRSDGRTRRRAGPSHDPCPLDTRCSAERRRCRRSWSACLATVPQPSDARDVARALTVRRRARDRQPL